MTRQDRKKTLENSGRESTCHFEMTHPHLYSCACVHHWSLFLVDTVRQAVGQCESRVGSRQPSAMTSRPTEARGCGWSVGAEQWRHWHWHRGASAFAAFSPTCAWCFSFFCFGGSKPGDTSSFFSQQPSHHTCSFPPYSTCPKEFSI